MAFVSIDVLSNGRTEKEQTPIYFNDVTMKLTVTNDIREINFDGKNRLWECYGVKSINVEFEEIDADKKQKFIDELFDLFKKHSDQK